MGKKTIVRLEPEKASVVEQIPDLTLVMAGLRVALKGVHKQMESVFVDSRVDMNHFVRQTENGLLRLRLNLGKLNKAWSEAFAPLGAVLLPVVNRAITAATGLVQQLGLMLGALFSGAKGADSMAQSTKKLNTQLKGTAGTVRRSLADFDRLNRLNSGTRGTTASVSGSLPAQPEALSPGLQAAVKKILELLEPIRNMDFMPLRESLQRLGAAFSGLGTTISGHLEWLWYELLMPLSTWVVEQAGPASVELLRAGFEALGKAMSPVLAGWEKMLPYMEPVAAFIGTFMMDTLTKLRQHMELVGQTFAEKGTQIQRIFENIGRIFGAVWDRIGPVLTLIRENWNALLEHMLTQLNTATGLLCDHLLALTEFVADVLNGRWSEAWNSLKGVFKSFANTLIGLLNGLLSGLTTGVNATIRALNRLKFDIPAWSVFGDMAGKSFGLQLQTVTAPKIPYLAQGAVLPANRPFLAMVGDQRHGTNVEAPLTTIQEAVALAMEDLAASNLAGQEAIAATLRQILEAVLGIHIGDDVIGSAAERYSRKMAVVRGGFV